MDQIITNLNAKLDFLNTLISVFQENKVEIPLEPYTKAVEITKRALLLTKRLYRLRYVLCKFVSIAKYTMLSEQDNIAVTNDLVFDYEVYLNIICVEFCILLGLSKSGGTSDNPNRVFNDAIKLNKTSKILNVQNTFLNIDGYTPTFNNAVKKLNQFKNVYSKEMKDIKDIRDQYAAHHDLNFNIDNVNTNVIISGLIELTNVWYEMCRAIGVISDITEHKVKKWSIDDYDKEITRIYKLLFNGNRAEVTP